MGDNGELSKAATTDVGWRLKQLRLRRGLQQKELARLAGIDGAFLNRLEHGSQQRSRPKTDTVNRLLNALDATPAECVAVFHAEPPALTPVQIEAQRAEFSQHEEDDSSPMMLIDEHWYRWSMSRMARLMFELSDGEYERTIGENFLESYVYESSPLYTRYPDEDRTYYFKQRLITFQTLFASQQFDNWYLEVAQKITATPLGAQLWHHPGATVLPIFLHHQEVRFTHSGYGVFSMDWQVNILLRNPRFAILTFKPRDAETQAFLDGLRDK